MALQPIISLLWQQNLAFFKLNWLLYPIIIIAIAISIFLRKKAPYALLFLILVVFLFSISLLGRPADWESIFRIFTNLLPLTFLRVMQQSDDGTPYPTFWSLYFFAIAFPLFFSYFQFEGSLPYYEFDSIDGEYLGRISGGYSKPNNFVAFLFPLSLFGFYRWQVQRKTVQGLFLVCFVLVVVYLTGLRTAVAIFFLIFVCSFFKRQSSRLIYGYYKYYLHFFVGVFSFLILFFVYQKFGLIDGLRGRIPMWLAHSNVFFRSSWIEILIGRGQVLLDDHYAGIKIIGSLAEVHNNTFRTILIFGLVGYFLYCLIIRWLVVSVFENTEDSTLKFIRLSCFLFLLLYSITNEPAYYSSILWSVLLGILPVWQKVPDETPDERAAKMMK